VELADRVLPWYDGAARDLPWRRSGVSPWAVLVSEVMLQQTPVRRVLPAYEAWVTRWPTPAALAAEPAGEAVRMWGKLGYPRRALRLHACAAEIVECFAGAVPADVQALESLPGIGTYTARAVASFAYGQRHPVVDTNVRRVIARSMLGQAQAAPASTARDHAAVAALLPAEAAAAARFGVAVMELGALVCTARGPRCAECPLAGMCAWRSAGYPDYAGARSRPQAFNGTDRQVRGLLMDVLRSAPGPVNAAALGITWPDPAQVDRALESLLADGLLEHRSDGRYALPA
jgi:A/G-specific adenine glycosylase